MKTASFRVDGAGLDEADGSGATALSLSARLYDWMDYRLNPVLLKDIRGWLRSKVFLIVFFIGLAAATATTVVCSLIAYIEVNVGAQLFAFIIAGLGFFMGGGVPYLMQEKLSEELENHSTELAFISRLTPAQFVRGKILSGLSVSMLFLSAAAPGLTVSYMLGGVGVEVMAYCLVSLIVLSVTSMMLGILFVSMRGKKRMRLVSLGLFAAGICIASLESVFAIDGARGRLFSDTEFLLVNAIIVIHLVPILYFLYTVAVCRLSFSTDNREARPRIALSILSLISYLCVCCMPLIYYAFSGRVPGREWILPGPAAVTAMVLFLVGFLLIADTEETLSMRLKASWPKSFVKRMLLYPGRGRLYAYLATHLFLFLLASGLSGLIYDSGRLTYKWEYWQLRCVGMVVLLAVFIGGTSLGCEWLRKIGLKLPRGIMLLTLALLWSIAGAVVAVMGDVMHWSKETLLISPPSALGYLLDHRSSTGNRLLTVAAVSLVVLIPAGIMWLVYLMQTIREDEEVSRLYRENQFERPPLSSGAVNDSRCDAASTMADEVITIDLNALDGATNPDKGDA